MDPKLPHLHLWSNQLAAGLAALITLLLFLSATYLADAQSLPVVQVQGSVTQPRLQLGDQILLERDGVHLSQPVLSPDGRWLAVTVVPLGTETADLAQTYLYATATGALQQTLAGHTPRWRGESELQLWQADRTLFYATDDTTFVLVAAEARSTDAPSTALPAVASALAYPETIRVAHHPSNGCRTVPAGQIDVIPFEEYVARVVPAESPASWPVAALAAQAVAARTYAWRQILAGRADYDVTDWANYQMMCDARYPNSDSAVALTAGYFLVSRADSAGLPISAMYSAENGHPTLTNPNVTYLRAVPDRFALGRTRNGHGYGLSQWGAYRRAVAGQSYRQILGHYYSNVYLRTTESETAAGGAFIRADPLRHLAVNALRLESLLPADLTPRLVVTASAGLTQAVTFNAASAVWRAPQALTAGTIITTQLWFDDAFQDQLTWTVDPVAPTAPNATVPPTLTEVAVTLPMVAATGLTPLLRNGWSWEGESLRHTANSGALVNDGVATGGTAWQAKVGTHQRGVWYGPYTTALPAGHAYRALFWLRAGINPSTWSSADALAKLDVADADGEVLLGLRHLWASDFADGEEYRPLAVDFYLFDEPIGVELRVAWYGTVDLALDRVEVWRLPDRTQVSGAGETNATFAWSLRGQSGALPFFAAQMDQAGNLSPITAQSVQVVDGTPPYFRPAPAAATWLALPPLSRTAVVSDSFSGLAAESGRATLVGEGIALTLPVTMKAPTLIWEQYQLTATLPTLTDGIYNLTFAVRDRAGNQALRDEPLLIDRVPPLVTITATGALTNGWYTEPITVTLAGVDARSGLERMTYRVAEESPQLYSKPWHLGAAGEQRIEAVATDQAGNQATATLPVRLDLALPVATLRQTSLTTTLSLVEWLATDDGSGIATVELAVRQGDGPWEPLTVPTTTVSSGRLEVPVSMEVTTTVRIRARDQVGRQGEWTELALWVATNWAYLPLVSR